jgi:hypothetical protein
VSRLGNEFLHLKNGNAVFELRLQLYMVETLDVDQRLIAVGTIAKDPV